MGVALHPSFEMTDNCLRELRDIVLFFFVDTSVSSQHDVN